jgi:hypothetical protein
VVVAVVKNAVETTDSTDAHGCSIKYKFVIIRPAGEGTSNKYFSLKLGSVSVVISEIRG